MKVFFPTSLKSAEIFPIFKKGDKKKISNWRPISLLNPFSKIFERHIFNEITQFINKYKLLHNFQYGFRENSSTELAITQLTEELQDNLQNKKSTLAVFIDLSKAFDTVDHQILLSKMHRYGIRGLAGDLLHSYLTGRSQSTIANNKKSKPEEITCGVPQGSILGPLLFNLYINDLATVSDLTVRLYADDACLTFSQSNLTVLQNAMNKELNLVNDWLKVNKLSVNYTKSNYLLFTNTKHKHKFNININGNTLEQIKETNYLGVWIDDQLNWKKHLEMVHKKISKASYIITKIRHYVDLSTLKILYYSLVFPHINYCITVWGGIYKSSILPIINLQKKIVRIITKSSFTAHANPIFLELKILPIKYIHFLNSTILFHKITHGKIIGFYNITPINKIHKYNTRLSKANNYFQTFNRLDVGKFSFCSMGLQFWKEIPTDYKQLPIHLFKYKTKQYLFQLLREDKL